MIGQGKALRYWKMQNEKAMQQASERVIVSCARVVHVFELRTGSSEERRKLGEKVFDFGS